VKNSSRQKKQKIKIMKRNFIFAKAEIKSRKKFSIHHRNRNQVAEEIFHSS